MWALGFLFLCLLAWKSGEHHAERAIRMVEHNRPERQRKWQELKRRLTNAENEVKSLREVLKKIANGELK